MYIRESILTNLPLTFFYLNINIAQDEGGRLGTKAIEGESPWVHKIVPVLNWLCVFDRLLHTLPVPALKLGPSFNCAKQ